MYSIHLEDGEWYHTEYFFGSLVQAVQYAKNIQAYLCCSAEIKYLGLDF